jgi:hypothetical protein
MKRPLVDNLISRGSQELIIIIIIVIIITYPEKRCNGCLVAAANDRTVRIPAVKYFVIEK